MWNLHTPGGAVWVLQLLASAFLAILFLQSGIDKVLDRAGNLQWLTGHFAKSALRGSVPLLLLVITVLELAAGVLTAIGFLVLLTGHSSTISFYGAVVSAIALLALFFGQRMAKEYAGAAVLVPYFILTVAAIYLLAY
ncbi:MAG: DoxX family membrane protein [Verrucomicrobia bacterium]|nr:DoxX family membrane protein [Verrucomicrobiota bacterium]